ncbi:hypothetical protein SDRG_06715 [Saprolegnia diclina VS20]|uniref:RING-type domain-containing protein n=1 Tax=Saprolegnia diclina (strain VS20) TaxID=1156394 RepID=T0RUA6_SAPDV|nr:hypothetical protein SDRG_06715 [Saprolegnia diclina VS20]EQC35973.1 hypothetical protein SDRG_06715 [Saprolegnia diclina VS20]|eukprot:XP_008610735.1 hypothetical protein SDRG_06715 [Saprolegnia diclina VS20]
MNNDDWAALLSVADLYLTDAHAFGVDSATPSSDVEMAIAAGHAVRLVAIASTLDAEIARALALDDGGDMVRRATDVVVALVTASAVLEASIQVTALCCVCHQQAPSVFTAPCRHEYCASCLAAFLQTATHDVSLLPLKCCRQRLDLDAVLRTGVLSATDAQRLRDRAEEKTAARPVYCGNPACTTEFVSARYVNGTTAICPGCRTGLCSACSRPAHPGACEDTVSEEALLELGAQEGWQRCPHCRRMVELTQGCNHMTCLCSAEFCYVCASRWKTCACANWDEARVLLAAQERLGAGAPARAVRQLAVQLRDRDECNHEGRWRRIDFPERSRRCELCSRLVYLYTLQCRHCQFQACRTCRGRRL